MSKIYEAIDNAGQYAAQRAFQASAAAVPAVSKPAATSRAFAAMTDMEHEMAALHEHLAALLPWDAHRVIQFIGSRAGEGTSTIAREFARVSASRFGQRVLLVGPGLDPTIALRAGVPFHVVPLAQPEGDAPSTERSAAQSLGAHRAAYDLVVVDSPPAAASPEGLALSRQADGVLLVLAAEETRWPVAERVKGSIERSGGRLLGIVLNKRRHHIPAAIYRRL